MPAPSRALLFARWAVDRYGRVDGDRVLIVGSQAVLAEAYGVSPGTVAWYVRSLGELVVAKRPLTLDRTALESALSSASPAPVDLSALADAAQSLSRIAATLSAMIREPSAGQREQFAASRDSCAVLRDQGEEGESDLLLPPQDANGVRGPFAGLRQTAGSSVAAVEACVDALLQPLAALAAARGLVGLTHPAGVRHALRGFEPGEIEAAVGRLIDEIEAGATIRRPFGVLVARAQAGDTEFFAPRRGRPVSVLRVVPIEAPEHNVDADDAVVERPPPGLLAELEAEAARRLHEQAPSIAGKALAMAPLRRALVADLWRDHPARRHEAGPAAEVS